MTDEEIERCLERLATCKTTDVMNFDYAGTIAYLNRLKAENAALRERLEKAVELTEPHWELCPYSGMCIVYYKAIVPKSEAYDDRAAAEARVAELKGEQNG